MQKTCEALHAAGGVRLKTFECILRIHEVHPVALATDLDADAPRAAGNLRCVRLPARLRPPARPVAPLH